MSDVLEVGAHVTAKIEEIGQAGEGVARAQGLVLFIPGALPGDVVEAEITDRRARFAWAELVGVLEPSPDRVVPRCPVALAGGGSPLAALSPLAQRQAKRRRLIGQLQHLGGLKQPPVAEVRAAGPDYGYRAKQSLACGTDSDGELVLGVYARHTHRVVPAADSLVADDAVRQASGAVQAALRKLRLPAYDEITGHGFVRHVIVRHAQGTGQLMILLVTRHAHWPGMEQLPDVLTDSLGEPVTCLAQSVNASPGNRILGAPPRILSGQAAIWEEVLGLRLRISPESFFQVNPKVAADLYRFAIDELRVSDRDLVVDAHCGVGALALLAARSGARAVGFETASSAIGDARAGARANGLASRCRFVLGEAERLYGEQFRGTDWPSRVVLDPPRSGLHPDLVASLRDHPPRRLVYVSCEGVTLARDLRKFLAGEKFLLERVVPFDLFPQTAHLEAVAVMRRFDKT